MGCLRGFGSSCFFLHERHVLLNTVSYCVVLTKVGTPVTLGIGKLVPRDDVLLHHLQGGEVHELGPPPHSHLCPPSSVRA